MLSLAEARFAGEPKDVVLEKLSSILLPLAREVDLYLGLYARQQKVSYVRCSRPSLPYLT